VDKVRNAYGIIGLSLLKWRDNQRIQSASFWYKIGAARIYAFVRMLCTACTQDCSPAVYLRRRSAIHLR
jgi:hypothetical protein